MARQKKQSAADVVVELVSRLPWWGGVALAIVSYLVLHRWAIAPDPHSLQPNRVGAFALYAIAFNLARILQYLVPVLCLVAAVISFFKQRQRRDLLSAATASASLDAVAGMSWLEFELLVGEGFRQQGYQVEELGGNGPDGGVDLLLRKGKEVFLVQCKHWKAFKVGVDVVRQLYGVMAARGAAGGFVVTAGDFTEDARAFASGRNIQLLNGVALQKLLQQTKRPGKPPTVQANVNAPAADPNCPSCGALMVKRTARKGSQAGNQFWGCSRYPACKTTR